MDQELKAKWVAALRGGEYKQGKFNLYTEGHFCCLGVLCVISGRTASELEGHSYPSDIGIDVGITNEVAQRLAGMNDGFSGDVVKTFAEIADFIEACL